MQADGLAVAFLQITEGEVKPAFPGSDVSDVRNPQVVWSFWGEVALH